MNYKSRLLNKFTEDEFLDILRNMAYSPRLFKLTQVAKDSTILTEKILYWYMYNRSSIACMNLLVDRFSDAEVSTFCLAHPVDACNIFYNRLNKKDVKSILEKSPINGKILLQYHPYYIEMCQDGSMFDLLKE